MNETAAGDPFATLISVLPEAVLIVSSAGEIEAANARAGEMLHCPVPRMTGRALAEFIPDEDGALATFLRAASRSRALLPAGLKVRTSAGTVECRCEGAVLRPRTEVAQALVLVRMIPKEAAVNRFIALNLRIDELAKEIGRRKRAESSLLEQRELLHVTLGSIGDAVIATDENGRITFMNAVAQTLTGWPAGEALGRPLKEVFVIANETTGAAVESPVAKVLREGAVVGLANHTVLRTRHGTIRPIDDSGAPIRRASGEVLGVVLVFRDVTERRNAERERVETDRRKDQFLAMLAHELRNPLAALGNGIQYVRRVHAKMEALDPASSEIGEAMQRQLQHLTRLVDDLLDVSRLTTGKIVLRKAQAQLQAILNNAIETCGPAISAREIDLRTAMPAEPVLLDADAARLSQVFCNLLTNAVKFSDAGATVDVSVEVEGGRAAVRVKDTGAGIAAEMLPSIFELFVQADDPRADSQGGLGVGLTVAKLITELHGGRIDARSEGRGRGSQFVVTLPLAQRAQDSVKSSRDGPSSSVRKQGRTVLVVDDNADAALTLALLLKVEGHDVHAAHDGEAALRLAESARPQVVLLDVGMPGMDGYEVARRLRRMESARDALVIAITGYGADADRSKAQAAGFDHHLTKPVDVEALASLIACARRPKRG